MPTRKMLFILGVVLTLCLGVAFPPGSYTFVRPDDFDDAEGLYKRFMHDFYDLKRLDKDELLRLVGAICDADEEERQSVSKDASDRVKDKVNYEYEKLKTLESDTLVKLRKVIEDDNYKERKSKAEDYKREVEETWNSVERMTVSLRGSNNPVVSYMLDQGKEAHKNYQGSSSNCTEAEWTIGNLRIDCLYASGSSCDVIELKPDNSRAISKGRGQLQDYVEGLSKPEELKRLQERNSKFSECKEFAPKLKCYTLCPEITDEGEFRSTSVNWRDCGP
jgi:hypothetical protein